MAQEIVAAPSSGIAPEWERKIDLIKRTVAKGATDDELQLFFHQAKKTGLDPLARQIYCVKRGSGMAIQTGIDGFRLIADRTGKYAGNDDYEFAEGKEFPIAAKARIWKIVDGERYPFEATARWSQYYPGDSLGFMWKKMPHVMLGKCAEALALRKAFPAELSGVYTAEEMSQAGPEIGEHEPPPPPARKTHSKPPAPEAVMCNQCRQVNRHAPDCPSLKPDAPKVEVPPSPQANRLEVMVSAVEKRATKTGNVFYAVSAVDKGRKTWALFLFHKSLHEFVNNWLGVVCIFETTTSAKGNVSIEKVLRAGDVEYRENRPIGPPVGHDHVNPDADDTDF
jgi:phage recombination protein Bet